MKLVLGETVYFFTGSYNTTSISKLEINKGKVTYIAKDFPFITVESIDNEEVYLDKNNVHETVEKLLNSIPNKF